MTTKLNLKINQGETFRHIIFWQDKYGNVVNLTGSTARMHIRSKIDSPTTLLELTTENGRITLVPATGEVHLYISDADTASISWITGVYDLEIITAVTDVVRLVEGQVSVSREVTRQV